MAVNSNKLNVNINISKNRLEFAITKKITKKELDKFYTDLRFCVADLKPNFDVIGNYSECDVMYLESILTFNRIMTYLVGKRIREKIRIVKDNLFCKQLKNLTAIQQIYEPCYVSTIQEAEELLSVNPRRKGLRIYLCENQAEYQIEEGKGMSRIVDISTCGCALETGSLHPSVDQEILLMLALKNQEASLEEFTIKAKVVRSASNTFAVNFIDFEDDQKDKLWNCLLYESGLKK